MIFRRVTALLTTLTMLHLAVVAGAGACGEHSTAHHGAAAGRTTTHAAMAEHAAGMVMAEAAGVGVSQASASNPPCETPIARRCCESGTGCSLTGTVDETVRGAPTVPDAARERYTSANPPASRRAAPEPPPPKA